MKRTVPMVLAFAGILGTLALFWLADVLAGQHLTDTIADPALLAIAVQRLTGQFALYTLPAMVIAGALGWMAGRVIMRPFERITAALAGPGIVVADGSFAEADALAHAASGRAVEFRAREAALAGTSAQLGQLVASVSEGLILLDAHGKVLRANPAAIRLLGMPQDSTSKNMVLLTRNVDVRTAIKRAMLGERIDAVEAVIDDRSLLINARPLRDGDAQEGTVISITDLTQLRRLESVRRDFVANVSHELKTPLTSIHGYSETLLQDENLPEDTRRQFIEVIDRNAVRLQLIVDELLDLARIESGAWQPAIEPVDVGELARDVWSECSELPGARRISFSTPEVSALVLADAGALRHVLSNVIGNAVRYTPAGGSIRVTVRDVAGAGAREMRAIDVTDTGAGIPTTSIPRIFERFYRVDPARSREAGGTGLGLAIVKHLVEGMDGTVSAASELTKGTTITITLRAP